MLDFWQNLPSKISPVVFGLGGFELRWYGLMYLVAFVVAFSLVMYRLKTEPKRFKYKKTLIEDAFLWSIIGLLIGGRLGYVLFYGFEYYSKHLLEIILPFSLVGGFHFTGIAGMSFHGAVVGIFIAAWIFFKKRKVDFWNMADLVIPALPAGYFFGRIGNFLNGELWGRATESGIGMYWPNDSSGLLRYPSQLLEAGLEGLVLFAILWSLRKRRNFGKGSMLGFYLIGYALARIIAEFFREPDEQLGFLLGFLTMGQLLSLAMMGIGVWVVWRRKNIAN